MSVLLSVSVVALGLIVGSFLNVLVLRLHTGKPISAARSACMSCGHTLAAMDLIPIVSFLIQRGRCRYCNSKISFQYLSVEFLTAATFFLIYVNVAALDRLFHSSLLGVTNFILLASAFSLLIAISVYDLRHKIIPDVFVYPFALVSFGKYAFNFYTSNASFTGIFLNLDFWAGPIVASVFAALWLISRGRLMGLGDAKLVVGLGFLFGAASFFSGLTIGFFIAALVGISLLLARRASFTMKSEIPLAPFLVAGALIQFALDLHLF